MKSSLQLHPSIDFFFFLRKKEEAKGTQDRSLHLGLPSNGLWGVHTLFIIISPILSPATNEIS